MLSERTAFCVHVMGQIQIVTLQIQSVCLYLWSATLKMQAHLTIICGMVYAWILQLFEGQNVIVDEN